MASTPDPWFARSPARRRPLEAGFWILAIGLHGVLNAGVAWLDLLESGRPISWWKPLLWEATSHVMVLALVPALVAWERRFPLHWDTLQRHLPWHLVGSVVFSLVHVAGMVGLRHALHGLGNETYDFGPWLQSWLYEYLKDVRTYVVIVAVLMGYRLLLLRLQGEARVLDEPDAPASGPAALPLAAPASAAPAAPPAAERLPTDPPPAARPERFLVRKLRREFLIAAADIDWVQAQANYVGLRVNGHDYLLRSTLAEFTRQLDPVRFVQVHRSYVVNLDRIAEIEPQDSGDARLKMRDGTVVPCSRRYRGALGASLA